jgi:alkylhydroperoxidase/carboxymuconolactone decarboxylase family protein YurZ
MLGAWLRDKGWAVGEASTAPCSTMHALHAGVCWLRRGKVLTGEPLKLHINVGFNVGLTKEKIVGALIHCIPYVGFPRVLNALTLVKQVMAERGLAPESSAD